MEQEGPMEIVVSPYPSLIRSELPCNKRMAEGQYITHSHQGRIQDL